MPDVGDLLEIWLTRLKPLKTVSEMAAEIKISRETIYRVLKGGENPRRKTVRSIANFLGFPYNEERNKFMVDGVEYPPDDTNPPDNIAAAPSDAYYIPEWPEMKLAASHFVEGSQEVGIVPLGLLQAALDRGRFRVTIRGDCMEEDWLDGELIEFELLKETDFIVGKDYYVECDQGATFKRCYEKSDDHVIIGCVKTHQRWTIDRTTIRSAAIALWFLGNRRK